MKVWIAGVSALLLATACSASKEATAALAAMKLQEGASSPLIKYTSKSGSGNSYTFKDVTIGDPETGTPGFKAASLVLGGLDMTAAGKPMVASITFKDITPAQPLGEGLTLNLSSIAVEGLNPVAAEYVAANLSGDQAAMAAPPPPFELWGFKKISVNGLTFAANETAMGAPGSKVNVQLGEFSVSDLKDTVFGNMHLSGLKGDFAVPGEMMMSAAPITGAFDFGTADVTKIRGKIYADMAGVGMESALAPSAQTNIGDKMMASYTSPIEPGFDTLNWTGMTAEAAGAKLEVSKVSSTATRNAEGVVTAVKTPRSTLTFTADAAGGTFGQLATMGLTMVKFPSPKVELYGESDVTYDPATDTTRAVAYNFGVTDALDIKMTAGLQGVTKALAGFLNMAMGPAMAGALDPLAALEQDPANPTAVPEPDMSFISVLKIVDLDVTITDKAVVGMLTALTGQPDEAARADIANQILASTQDMVTGAGADAALASEFTTALAGFVKQPGSLNIKMKPAAPVAFGGATPLTKQSLGFTASFTPSPAAPAPAPSPN